jgi:hypothetical protein
VKVGEIGGSEKLRLALATIKLHEQFDNRKSFVITIQNQLVRSSETL